MLDDYPHFFWLSGAGEFITTTRNNVVQHITFKASLRNNVTLSTARAMYNTLKFQVDRIIAKAKQYNTVFEQVLFVHDYIVDNTDYVLNAPNCYDAYGCIVDHRAVCSGYSKAFQLILCCMGYKCGKVSGSDIKKGSVHDSHAWNYIKLDDDYYYVDVTWDDPVSQNAVATSNKTYEYFCITTEELLKTHIISSDQFVPDCKGRKYDYYVYKGYYLDRYSFEGVERIAQKQLATSNKFSVKFSSSAQLQLATDDLINNQRVYKIKGMSNRISYSTSKAGLVLTIERK